jgi:hypothetical protein
MQVDTALLYRSTEGKTASLRELAIGLLGSEQEQPHDSVSDAQIAYRCAELALTLAGPLPVVDKFAKSFGAKGRHKGGAKGSRRPRDPGPDPATSLLVHRLPPGTTAASVESLFVDAAAIKPHAVTDVEFGLRAGGPTGRCHVTFRSAVHCGLAFESLQGHPEEDPSGKVAKRVWLEAPKPGARRPHIKVRKML